MSGETNLARLLANLTPELDSTEYVYCCVKQRPDGITDEDCLAYIHEREGLTLVLTRQKADALQLSWQGPFHCVCLTIHSSLEAVGLTAAVSGALAQNGVSANMLAGYYHDHILIPCAQAEQAMQVLQGLTKDY
ncbi:ACT domain-containing protein [Bowmanella sp. JS7-9]|uniref:ACT domain-containing protein n=1 Tax=Pseudobowmanella zhangzhouensis TaxID=1537679 RepID=A0ABW1XPH6_9ALTE|nr:ACT domain-containing protein [Bowmanella sp. JS7-9]TBX20588.1 hypothetical protein TK45_14875 [Bowmanella sp. JS7-9]